MLTLERTRNGFQAGLLPSAACLPVLEDFIAANHAGGVKLERLPFCLGPEHEGRVAVGSPGDGDRTRRQPVLHDAVLAEDGGWIRLGYLPIHDADKPVRAAHKMLSLIHISEPTRLGM